MESRENSIIDLIGNRVDSVLENIKITPPESSRNIRQSQWNKLIEISLKQTGEKATGYKIMHIKTARRLAKKFTTLMYLGIIVGPLSGAISSIGEVMREDPPSMFSVSSIIISFLSGILIASLKFGKFEEQSSAHKLAASRYTSLESNIRRQLLLDRKNRVDASIYMDWVGKSFDELFMASPIITTKIYDDYVSSTDKIDITIPDKYDKDIYIDEDYENTKIDQLSNNAEIDIKVVVPEKETPPQSSDATLKGKKKISRTDTFSHFADFGKYSDGQMKYELGRMFGFHQG